jgi:Ca2+-binding EF-hand superfamily protein
MQLTIAITMGVMIAANLTFADPAANAGDASDTAAFEKGKSAKGEGAGDKARRGKGKRGGKLFERADANGDSVLDATEFRGNAERFANIDTDSNGSLTREELEAGHKKHKGKRGGKRFKKSDANGDGALDSSEFRGPAKAFSRLDADNDGKLTREELKAGRKGKGQGPRSKRGGRHGGDGDSDVEGSGSI